MFTEPGIWTIASFNISTLVYWRMYAYISYTQWIHPPPSLPWSYIKRSNFWSDVTNIKYKTWREELYSHDFFLAFGAWKYNALIDFEIQNFSDQILQNISPQQSPYCSYYLTALCTFGFQTWVYTPPENIRL